jgi:hypothetical protein
VVFGALSVLYTTTASTSSHDAPVKVRRRGRVQPWRLPVQLRNHDRKLTVRCGVTFRHDQMLRTSLSISRTILLLPVVYNAASVFACGSVASSALPCGQRTHVVYAFAVTVLLISFLVLLLACKFAGFRFVIDAALLMVFRRVIVVS